MIRHVAWALALLALASAPVRAQDAAELLVRVGRLEGQIRQLSGQIEQLQFQNQRLEEQLRKFQQDVEFRFQEQGGGPARPNASTGIAIPPTATPPGTQSPPAANRSARGRGDAFDPSAQPGAPGAPRTLGSADSAAPPPAAPMARAQPGGRSPGGLIEDGAEPSPLDLSTMARPGTPIPQGGAPLPSAALPQGTLPAPGPAPVPVPPGGAVASAGTGQPRDDYDLAYGLLMQRQYDQAEMAFRQYLQAWPRDRMVPNAIYWLGETYYRRQRYPDAVEQYLKIFKTYGSAKIAPESMLKLALALRGMDQPQQACATLAEVGRKYPDASPDVKASVEREQKRGGC
jgi:tol-pal system protein YbgF